MLQSPKNTPSNLHHTGIKQIQDIPLFEMIAVILVIAI